MKIQTRARGITLDAALKDRVERRVDYALGSLSAVVRRVDVLLADDNGPRGGSDQRCQIRVTLEGLPVVQVTDVQSDMGVAIDRAAGRAGRTLARLLERVRTRDIDRRWQRPDGFTTPEGV